MAVSDLQGAVEVLERWRSQPDPDGAHPGPEAGMSLVEVMVAILLLGIILSAAASSLIQFGRTAADNERRVQSTALMNRVHEQLQGLQWQDAVLYEDELQVLLDEGFPGLTYSAQTGDPGPVWRFEGDELVTLDGPGTLTRRDTVPVVREPLTIDDRDYDLHRFITWSDPVAGVKQFITIVGWSLYDRRYEERFLSERAATSTEAGDPERPRVVQFNVGPSPMPLDQEEAGVPGSTVQDLQVSVRFSSGVTSASLHYTSYEVVWPSDPDDPDAAPTITEHERTVDLGAADIFEPGGTGGLAFSGTISAASERFNPGPVPFRVTASDGGEGVTSVTFLGADEEVDTDNPVSVESVAILPSTACVDNKGALQSDVRVTANISGLDPDAGYLVTAELSNGAEGIVRQMEPVSPDTFASTNAEFDLTLNAGTVYDFVFPQGSGNTGYVETTALIIAERTSNDAPPTPAELRSDTVLRIDNFGACP